MKETFRKDYDLFWSVKIRQTNKSLAYCMYKNDIITCIYFCLPCSNGGVLVIMRTVTSLDGIPHQLAKLEDIKCVQRKSDIAGNCIIT